ncbi:hypothetical protein [Cupriavidus sp. EM10]|nr:hypothetical protein [Cupriavidus sp. EM10]
MEDTLTERLDAEAETPDNHEATQAGAAPPGRTTARKTATS